VDINGEERIAASCERVWQALNDPAVLQQCIKGCEQMDRISENEMQATVLAKFGPVKARFKANIKLVMVDNIDSDAQYSCRLSGEGQGGAAGFAKGAADITLKPDGDNTLLTYRADMSVGGKLAQVGSRLVSGTTNKIVDEFFTKLPTLL